MDCPQYFSIAYKGHVRYIRRRYTGENSRSMTMNDPNFRDTRYTEINFNGDGFSYCGNLYEIINGEMLFVCTFGIVWCSHLTYHYIPYHLQGIILFCRNEYELVTAIPSSNIVNIFLRGNYFEFTGDEGQEWAIEFNDLQFRNVFLTMYKRYGGFIYERPASVVLLPHEAEISALQLENTELNKRLIRIKRTNSKLFTLILRDYQQNVTNLQELLSSITMHDNQQM